ncbi:hypothetical protein V2G26_015664 [Clonostachys chloroleuca]
MIMARRNQIANPANSLPTLPLDPLVTEHDLFKPINNNITAPVVHLYYEATWCGGNSRLEIIFLPCQVFQRTTTVPFSSTRSPIRDQNRGIRAKCRKIIKHDFLYLRVTNSNKPGLSHVENRSKQYIFVDVKFKL